MTDISRELLDDCVHCGFCLPTCPTYGPLWQEEMDSPRGRILLMDGLVEGTVELSPTTVQHFDRCLGCMACLTSCPSGVRYDRLIEQTRAHVEEHYQRSDDERLMRALVFATVPHPRRLRLALALTPPRLPGPLAPFASLRPPWRSARRIPEVTPAVGKRRMRVGLLLGCVQRVVFGDVNAATARVLRGDRTAEPGLLRRAPPARRSPRRRPTPRRSSGRTLSQRRRDRRQRRRLRLTPEGVGASRSGC
jgi:glycolate oxidase iron-sulfur subunit